MKLLVELPDYNITAKAIPYPDRAPRRCAAIWESLKVPFVTKTRHAIFEGYEIYAFLPPFKEIPPMENQTMRPKPGDITNFVLGKKGLRLYGLGHVR
ncbi:DUF3830 family protein [Mesorhizobium sp. B3-1-3]|uniref:DUF3830 family protein n=1 Tax=unclassified Mesorhizobium TaxID=325217 RepID=UPI00112A0843|nr:MULTISPECIES: DUF3830 family protein [unclassified Mesorhizobium]TPI63368.1 DUF3830 family protein [Mesorhizobium sp. B3-1-8]TPI72284.1 DUF3830 family protein [Mesorhizobium sp. B3-1-3]